MPFEVPKRYRGSVQSLNVIPFVDILFQLIIFFSLACQFIEAGNLPVSVPDNCNFANADDEPGTQITTVTVIKTGPGRSDFSVGSEKITASNYGEIADKVASLLDSRLRDLPADSRIVTLRIDKNVPFAEAQYALAAVAKSAATDIRLAATRDGQAKPE
jgi:biopolymer transport protein ExbD